MEPGIPLFPPCLPGTDGCLPAAQCRTVCCFESLLKGGIMSESRLFTMRHASSKVGLVTFWLAMGTFAFGAGEFASMSLLPSIAADLGTQESTAGHIITAYALGVVIGAPIISVFGAKWPRKPLMLSLLAALILGNLFAASAPTIGTLVLARFLSGIPHGAFIGVAMLFASSLTLPTKQARAVSNVQLGITVATIVGVPAFTLLGHVAGWRLCFVLMSAIAAAVLVALWRTAPNTAGNRMTSAKLEMTALKNPKVLLTLVTGAVGFGGIFAIYSYFTSAFQATGAGPGWALSLILMLYGVGSTAGSFLAGFIKHETLLYSALGFQAVLGLSSALYAVSVGNAWLTGVAMVMIGASGGLVVPLQTRLMMAAGDAQTLAAAMNHVAFNLANGVGPLVAGTVMGMGGGWASTGWVAVAFSMGGLALLVVNVLVDRRSPIDSHAVRFEVPTATAPITGLVPILH